MAFHPPCPGSASGSGSSLSSGFHFLNSAFGDTTYTKVFVGGLAWETTSEALSRYFERFGDILEAVVITDKRTGRSKGYGFVTFCDPECASKACADPSPVIDGRRVNCNLASLGRPRPAPLHARPRPATPFIGSVPVLRGTHIGGAGQQQLAQFSYPYGYTAHGPGYVYSQNAYDPYVRQQYGQIYCVPGAVNTAVYPFGQLGLPIPGVHGYTAIHGYTFPGHHFVQIRGPNVDGVATVPLPALQPPFPAGVAAPIPAHPHFIVPARLPQFAHGSVLDKTVG